MSKYRKQYEDDELISRTRTKVGKLRVSINILKFENKNSKKICQIATEQSKFTPTITFQLKYRYKFEGDITKVRIHWVEDSKQQTVRQPLNFLTKVCDRTKL